jgi:hypothetical protein
MSATPSTVIAQLVAVDFRQPQALDLIRELAARCNALSRISGPA